MTTDLHRTPDGGFDTAGAYDYGPTVSRGRIWVCSGRNTDAIDSVNLDGTGPAKAFTVPGRLVADPSVLWLGSRWLMAFTVGFPNGRNNGIRATFVEADGRVHPITWTVVAPGTSGLYGRGQPGLVRLADGRVACFFRDDGAGAGVIKAAVLDEHYRAASALQFDQSEDGASPEPFLWQGKVWLLVTGGGLVGLRSYVLIGDMLTRDRHLEQGWPLPGGAGDLWARIVVPAPGVIDGACVERAADNLPVIMGGSFRWYVGAGDPANPGTWHIRSGTIPAP